MVMNMAVTIKIPNPDELGILEETNPLYLNQIFYNQVINDTLNLKVSPSTINNFTNYIASRYVSSDDYSGLLIVDNLYNWIQTNCKFDDNDYKFINLKLRDILDHFGVTTINDLGDRLQFLGNIRRNYNGDIQGIHLRSIPYDTITNNNVRMFLKFFYNKKKDIFEVWYDTFSGDPKDPRLEGVNLNAWRDYYKLTPLREFNWNKIKKEQLNLNERIFVTESIYDSLFLENSMCLGGVVQAMLVPEKLKRKDILFILDNSKTSFMYTAGTNLVRMGYSVFAWPKSMDLFKDFNEYVSFIYRYSDKTLTNDEFVKIAKGYIRKLVYTDKNIINGGDLEGYDKWFFNK